MKLSSGGVRRGYESNEGVFLGFMGHGGGAKECCVKMVV